MSGETTDHSDLALHVRRVHFALVAVCLGLLSSVALAGDRAADRASRDLTGINNFVAAWDRVWVDYSKDQLGRHKGALPEWQPRQSYHVILRPREVVEYDEAILIPDYSWVIAPRTGDPFLVGRSDTPGVDRFDPQVRIGPDDHIFETNETIATLNSFRAAWDRLQGGLYLYLLQGPRQDMYIMTEDAQRYGPIDAVALAGEPTLPAAFMSLDLAWRSRCLRPTFGIEPGEEAEYTDVPRDDGPFVYCSSISPGLPGQAVIGWQKPHRLFEDEVWSREQHDIRMSYFFVVPILRTEFELAGIAQVAGSFFDRPVLEGPFAAAFPDLDEATAMSQDLSLDSIRRVLLSEQRRSGERFSIAGATVRAEDAARWGLVVLVAAQAYFLLHLRRFADRVPNRADRAWGVAWIGLYDDPLSVAATALTSFVLPVVVAVVIRYSVDAEAITEWRTGLAGFGGVSVMPWLSVVPVVLLAWASLAAWNRTRVVDPPETD